MVRILAVDAIMTGVAHVSFIVNYLCTNERNRVRRNSRVSVAESEFNDVRFLEALNNFVDGQLENNTMFDYKNNPNLKTVDMLVFI
jgi:hypothetical protein